MAWMEAFAGEKVPWIFAGVVGDKLVHPGREADDFRGDVVNEDGPIDSGFVQMFEKRLRRAAKFGDLVEVRPL
jgi:hypothetical protein